jgi:ribonuclease-3
MEVEEILGFRFQNKALLQEALTHPSMKKNLNKISYQRLEFLGDSVLSLIISEYLLKEYSAENEGDIHKRRAYVICASSCVSAAHKIGIEKFVILAKNQKINDNILADIIESVIGAIYLDGGKQAAEVFILNAFKEILENLQSSAPQDSKSRLQELCIKKYKFIPSYKVISETELGFEVETIIKNQSFKGKGRNIKAAEKEAANKAIILLFH